MSPDLTLGLIVLAPVALLLFLRVNATLVFLSLCLGNVLVEFVGPEAVSFVEMFSANNPTDVPTDNDTISLILLLLPVVLTTIFMIKTVRGHLKLLLNALPAAGVGLLGALLVVPLLPPGLSNNIVDSSLWTQVQNGQTLIVGASALVCLLVLWMQRPKTGHDGKHGKKGKH